MVLSPHLLKGHQQFAKEQLKCSEDKPLFLVMHGGSGSTAAEIGEAVGRQSLLFKYEIQIHKYHYSNTKYKYTNTIR